MNTDVTSDLFQGVHRSGTFTQHTTLPDPYVLYSTEQMPRHIEDVLRLCENVWLNSGQYKMAMQRIGRYFLTKLIFDKVSDTEKKKYEEFFEDVLDIYTLLAEVADDFLCYGNSFTSLYIPFNRFLHCTKCNFVRNIAHVPDDDLTLDVRSLVWRVMCPRCKQKTEHKHKDIRSTDQQRFHIIRWNPHEFQLLHDFMSGKTSFLWRITPQLKSNILAGRAFYIKTMPWEIIEAISKGVLFQFNDDIVYHMKEPVIAGVKNRGWGIPRALSAYKDIYYIQILKRYNEALALDYIVPFRIITPQKATSADPLMQYDMGTWSGMIHEMIAQHRQDPAGWHTMPFPVEYQVLGGEGATLSPWQLIKQGQADMMDALGIPMELYQGTLQLRSAPTALRLFEATWPHLVSCLNGFMNWLMKKCSSTFNWPPAKAKLQPVRYADDLDRQNLIFQLQGAQQVSKQTAFAPLGIDADEEQRRMLEETKSQMEAQKEFDETQAKTQELEETMAQQTQPQMGPGGMPMSPPQPIGGMPGLQMPGQGQMASTPQEMISQAQAAAEQLMGMPETQRKSQLIQLKRVNPVLHAQVRQIMDDMSQQAGTQGVAQMRQQMQAGGGMM